MFLQTGVKSRLTRALHRALPLSSVDCGFRSKRETTCSRRQSAFAVFVTLLAKPKDKNIATRLFTLKPHTDFKHTSCKTLLPTTRGVFKHSRAAQVTDRMFESDCVAEVETLLCHNPTHHDVICPVVHPLVHYSAQSLWKDFTLLNGAIPGITTATGWQLWWHEQLNEYLRQLDVGVQPHCGHNDEKDVVVRGQDIGDLPTTYIVQSLLPHELPIIGTYVDRRIVPGFTYTVRVLGSKRSLFAGNPMLLQSVGCGYGKRITFEGPTLNHNTNYFYSDSHASGCAFSIVAVGSGDHFIVMDSAGHAVGQAIIDCVESQKEVSSYATPEGSVEKRVNVVFSVLIQYSCQPNGKLSLFSDKVIEAMGIVVLVKAKRAAKASVIRLERVRLPHFGMCSFEPIPKSTK